MVADLLTDAFAWVHDTMPGLGSILVLVVVLYLLWTLLGGGKS